MAAGRGSAVHVPFIVRGDNDSRPADEEGPARMELRNGSRAMKRRIITWVATGAVVLGIGAAGVGAVVANHHSASSQSSAPVAAAPAAAGSQSQTAQTPAAPAQSTPMVSSGEAERPDQQAQAGSVQTGVMPNSGGAAGITGAASHVQGG
jgi:hypothetical protein